MLHDRKRIADRVLPVAGTAALALALAACSSSPPARSVGEAPVSSEPVRVSTPATAQLGTVRSITVVPESSRSATAGAVLGAVIGGAVGNQVGSGSGRTAATGVGAIGGAIAGHEIGKRQANEIYRIEVRMDDGTMRTFDYREIGDLRIGDRVRADGSQLYRI